MVRCCAVVAVVACCCAVGCCWIGFLRVVVGCCCCCCLRRGGCWAAVSFCCRNWEIHFPFVVIADSDLVVGWSNFAGLNSVGRLAGCLVVANCCCCCCCCWRKGKCSVAVDY